MAIRSRLRIIRAKYDGTCNRCSKPIKAGEKIFYAKTGLVAHTSHIDCEFKPSGKVKGEA